MRRSFLVGLLAAACAALVLAPTASAARFALTGLSVGSLGQSGTDCAFTVTLTYNGKLNSSAIEEVHWVMGSVERYASITPPPARGTAQTFSYPMSVVGAGTAYFFAVVRSKTGRQLAVTGYTAPSFSTTAGTCPAANAAGTWSWSGYST